MRKAITGPFVKPTKKGPISLEAIIWGVEVGSAYVPRATCLTQALAAKILLSLNGHESVLKIGVGRGEDGDFKAHAWLSSEGKTILGGGICQFTPLLSGG